MFWRTFSFYGLLLYQAFLRSLVLIAMGSLCLFLPTAFAIEKESTPVFSEESWSQYFSRRLEDRQKIEMELNVMIDCPYGIQAERLILPLALAFPENLDLKITYLADATLFDATGQQQPECRTGSDNSFFPDFLPITEQYRLEEQVIQVLIREYVPERFFDYLMVRIGSPADRDWSKVAEEVGIEPSMLREWLRTGEGLDLLQLDIERCREMEIFASPTLFIDGREYDAPLSSGRLLKEWCGGLHQSSLFCENLPECWSDLDCENPLKYCVDGGMVTARCIDRPQIPVQLTLLGSSSCRSCFSNLIIDSARHLFPNLILRQMDIHSATGFELAEQLGIERLPVYLFDPSIEEATPVFENLKPILKKTSMGYLVDPEIHERPLIRGREYQPGRIEFWFQPGDSLSDQAEDWWAKQIASGTFPLQPEIHYLIIDPTTVLQPRFDLIPADTSDTLVLTPQANPRLKELEKRYQSWGLPGEQLLKDIDLASSLGFIEPGGGALLHNQVWFQGWSPETIRRILFEMKNLSLTPRR